MFRYYKDGILSLEGLAKKLDISISEPTDLLAKLGLEAPMEPHGQSPCLPAGRHGSQETPTRGEHPVPEDQFTHG
jgi:hypothetical protein